ncbi:hypothetical protein B0H14DRAFT_3864119 [Mycena olivaceomarginata]|nr:hypothetical protein B0H14DRAFT_3864119 [Mycena olivaceomarginata]
MSGRLEAAYPRKLLSPSHSIDPTGSDLGNLGDGTRFSSWTPLHVAAHAGNTECTRLLFAAGASPSVMCGQERYQPLHLAAEKKEVVMVRLLLDHQAPIDSTYGYEGRTDLSRVRARARGGGRTPCEPWCQSRIPRSLWHAFGFAVHGRQVDIVRFLLQRAADATVIVPLFVNADGKLPPQEANLLYIAFSLRHLLSDRGWRRYAKAGNPPQAGKGPPGHDEEGIDGALAGAWIQRLVALRRNFFRELQ